MSGRQRLYTRYRQTGAHEVSIAVAETAPYQPECLRNLPRASRRWWQAAGTKARNSAVWKRGEKVGR